jgi:hypothetical protein
MRLRQMVEPVMRAGRASSKNRAFMLMSLVADVHVTQLVNNHKGIHVMFPKVGSSDGRGSDFIARRSPRHRSAPYPLKRASRTHSTRMPSVKKPPPEVRLGAPE